MNLTQLRGDILGGVTAAVVALPLALAFGVASGAGAMAGVYGAFAVGLFAALLGGTPAQISGPTAPMTVVMAAIVAQHADNPAEAFAVVVLGGAFQVALGLARLGRYVSYTPYSVISGVMSGVGVILILLQVLPFFGLPFGGVQLATVQSWPSIPGNVNWDAVAIGSLCLAVMIYWPRNWRAIVPPPLAALLLGTLLGLFVFPKAPMIGPVIAGLPALAMPAFPLPHLPGIVQAAFVLALLGSIDSLLTSLVADTVTRTRHRPSKELVGQGIGNMVAGLIGGLPGAGGTMRTVVNIRAGGRTWLSGAIHAFVLLALVLGMTPLVESIPQAVLAAILIKVGWDIIDWGYLTRIRRAPRERAIIMLATLALAVFVDLMTAVMVGMIVASFVTSRWMESENLNGVTSLALPQGDDPLTAEEREMLLAAEGQVAVIGLSGSFSYASARELTRRVDTDTAGHRAVVFDFSEAAHIDAGVALAFEALIVQTCREGACFIAALSGNARRTLDGLGVLANVPKDRILQSRLKAIEAAVGSVIGPAQPGGLGQSARDASY